MEKKELSVSLMLTGNSNVDLPKLEKIKQSGVKAVEIDFSALTKTRGYDGNMRDKTPEEFKTACESIPFMIQSVLQSGLTINSFHLPYSGVAQYIYSNNEEQRLEAVSQVCEVVSAVQTATKDISYKPYFVMHAGAFSDLLRLPTEEEKQVASGEQLIRLNELLEDRNNRISNAIESIAEIARNTGAQLAVENLNGANPCSTPQEFVNVINKINELNGNGEKALPVGAVVDTGHCTFGVRPEDMIRAIGKAGIFLFGLHISDRHIGRDNASSPYDFRFDNKTEYEVKPGKETLTELLSMSKGEVISFLKFIDEHLLPGDIKEGGINFNEIAKALEEIGFTGRLNAEINNDATRFQKQVEDSAFNNFFKDLASSLIEKFEQPVETTQNEYTNNEVSDQPTKGNAYMSEGTYSVPNGVVQDSTITPQVQPTEVYKGSEQTGLNVADIENADQIPENPDAARDWAIVQALNNRNETVVAEAETELGLALEQQKIPDPEDAPIDDDE